MLLRACAGVNGGGWGAWSRGDGSTTAAAAAAALQHRLCSFAIKKLKKKEEDYIDNNNTIADCDVNCDCDCGAPLGGFVYGLPSAEVLRHSASERGEKGTWCGGVWFSGKTKARSGRPFVQ